MAYLKDGIISPHTTDPGLQEARQKLAVMSIYALRLVKNQIKPDKTK